VFEGRVAGNCRGHLGRISVGQRDGIAKGDRVSESKGPGVRTSESLVSIHGDVSDDGVVARPRGGVQFFEVGDRRIVHAAVGSVTASPPSLGTSATMPCSPSML